MSDNPWNLTRREAEVMDALVEHGCTKLAARALFIDEKTIEAHTYNAARKMPQRMRVQRLIAWDRWRRGAEA